MYAMKINQILLCLFNDVSEIMESMHLMDIFAVTLYVILYCSLAAKKNFVKIPT